MCTYLRSKIPRWWVVECYWGMVEIETICHSNCAHRHTHIPTHTHTQIHLTMSTKLCFGKYDTIENKNKLYNLLIKMIVT